MGFAPRNTWGRPAGTTLHPRPPPAITPRMSLAFALCLALILDAAFGEPRWLWSRLPHPAVLTGRAVAALDRRLNRAPRRRLKGIAALLALIAAAALIGLGLAALPGQIAEVLAAAVLLAQRSLSDHVAEVAKALRRSLPEARAAVARIVGRDTSEMDEPAVARAAIESGAENLSDGVVAPAVWFLIGGLPAMLAYKALNTADSMIGYRTERHEAFGWAAARLDDIANLIPARLTALLLLAAARHRPDLRDLAAAAGQHRSPNAGWPEAAMAQALNVTLSGPRRYHGRPTDDPPVHPQGRPASRQDIDAAVRLLWRSWALLLALAAVIALLT